MDWMGCQETAPRWGKHSFVPSTKETGNMKMSYLSGTVFGTILMAIVLLPGWSEPGKPSAVEPVSRAQEAQGKKATSASKNPAQGGGKKTAELVGSVDDKALLNAAGNTA